MEQNYKNGVVTITDPGIYLIQSSLRNFGGNNMRSRLIKDHQIPVIDNNARPWMTSEINHVMYLDFLDTVNIQLFVGGPHDVRESFLGYFTVIKMD